ASMDAALNDPCVPSEKFTTSLNGTAVRMAVTLSRGTDTSPPLIVEEAPQLPAPARMFQLAKGLRLDLANTFARHRELLADFFQRMVGIHANAEPHAQHA